MTLGQLRAFEAVARLRNLTKAAHELKVTEPTISKQLQLLQKTFGVKLHTSTGQGIKLTEEGQLVGTVIRPVLQRIDELQWTIQNRGTDTDTVRLRIGGSIAASASLLPELLKAFLKTHPKVQPVLRTGSSKFVEEMLLCGDVDVAVITHPSRNNLISVESLSPTEVIAAVSSKHPVAKKGRLNAQELMQIPTILVKEGSIARQIAKIGLKLNLFMQCESLEAAKATVSSGLGLGFFYHGSIVLELKAGHLKSIDVPRLHEIDGQCFIIYLTDAQLSSNALDFLARLRQHARKVTAPRLHSA
jgi:DNA-binding transcriptional LysR family regulator